MNRNTDGEPLPRDNKTPQESAKDTDLHLKMFLALVSRLDFYILDGARFEASRKEAEILLAQTRASFDNLRGILAMIGTDSLLEPGLTQVSRYIAGFQEFMSNYSAINADLYRGMALSEFMDLESGKSQVNTFLLDLYQKQAKIQHEAHGGLRSHTIPQVISNQRKPSSSQPINEADETDEAFDEFPDDYEDEAVDPITGEYWFEATSDEDV